ncbi:hypothetical protein EV175_006660, partial [Coemansia sp. RSA 1933]
MKFFTTTFATAALSVFVSAAPVASPAGTLGGVIDAVAPITTGVGTTLNGVLGFGPGGAGGLPGGAGGLPGGAGGLPGGLEGGLGGLPGGHGGIPEDIHGGLG